MSASSLLLEASAGCILTQSYGEFRVHVYLLNLGKEIFFYPQYIKRDIKLLMEVNRFIAI